MPKFLFYRYLFIDIIFLVRDSRTDLQVNAFSRAIYSYTHEKVTLVRKGGTDDMKYYGSDTGFPCVTYGPGDPHLDHTGEDHILVEPK